MDAADHSSFPWGRPQVSAAVAADQVTGCAGTHTKQAAGFLEQDPVGARADGVAENLFCELMGHFV